MDERFLMLFLLFSIFFSLFFTKDADTDGWLLFFMDGQLNRRMTHIIYASMSPEIEVLF